MESIANLNAMDQPTPKLRQTGPVTLSENNRQAQPRITQQTITVQTSDNQDFMIPVVEAQKIPTLSNMLGDIGEEQTMAIPLPTIDSVTFKYVLKLVNKTVDLNNVSVHELFKPSDQSEFFNHDLSHTQSIKLSTACEFLGLEDYQQQLAARISKSNLTDKALHGFLVQLCPPALQAVWRNHPAYQCMVNSVGYFIPNPTQLGRAHISSDNCTLFTWSHKQISTGREKTTVWNLKNMHEKPRELWYNKQVDVVTSNNHTLITKEIAFNELEAWNMLDLKGHPQQLASRRDYISWVDYDDNHIVAVSERPIPQTVFIWNIKSPYNLRLKLHYEEQELTDFYLDQAIFVFSYLRNRNILNVLDLNNLDQPPRELTMENHDWTATRGIRTHGKTLIAVSDSQIAVFDTTQTGTVPYALLNLSALLNGVCISPKANKLLVSGIKQFNNNSRHIVKIWDLEHLDNPPHVLNGSFNGLTMNPYGKHVVSWNSHMIQIWNTNKLHKQPYKIYGEHEDLPDDQKKDFSTFQTKVGISTDNKKLIVLGALTLKLWNLENLREQPEILQHSAMPTSLAISPDCTKLISKTKRGFNVWDMNIIEQLKTLNLDQIKLMIWLYRQPNIEDKQQPADSTELRESYKSLPVQLQRAIAYSFPQAQALLAPALSRYFKKWIS